MGDFVNNMTPDGSMMEGEDKKDYFSPSGLPCVKHGDFKMAQSLPVEAYLSSIAPKFSCLTPQQRGIDGVVCAIKEDVNSLMAKFLFSPLDGDGGDADKTT